MLVLININIQSLSRFLIAVIFKQHLLVQNTLMLQDEE